ncbi:MAG: nucleotidyltransferase domain-containing protein [Candidatus Methylomirabilota bacterium]|nr:nucleotidyltransferase domain-containing protein [candidate division NC10 bacterium]PWB43010.1 MAG: nucleotidyltransferase domain-containing protein [candidate division NC10 bacterium]
MGDDPLDREQIRQILALYFANRPDVRMAFLFGSVERGVASTESDLDVAVYLEDESAEGTLWTDVERLVGREVDLVVLNRAPALIGWSAIRGTPLLIRDRGFFLDYLLEVSEEAESLAEFNLDFWKLRDRARAAR